MAQWSAEQVADLLMDGDVSDDAVSSDLDSEDIEFLISSSDNGNPAVLSKTDSSDGENASYVTRGRSRTQS